MLEALKEQSYNYWAWYKQQIPNLTQFSHHISNQEIMMRIEDLVIVAINQMSQAENPSLRYLQ